jgi:2,3-bisphosphoglycerate-dependent phosphoglycerate mutase
MKIFLIRHGESICNTGENFQLRLPDHKVYLTDNGKLQANQSGKYLSDYFNDNKIDLSKTRMWISPYQRTRQTAEIINQHLNIMDVKEHINLVEQQYGLFDSLPYEEWGQQFPNEFAHYNRCYEHEGKFWARFPMGESVFDVALRVHNFFGTVMRDYENKGIDTLVIVTHGTTLRTFVLQWLHHSPEWIQNETNPGNCWIRLIDDKEDKGYIYCKM